MPPYAPLLLAAYVCLLPFQRLGIPFLGHRVAPADGVLALAVLAALPVWRRSDPSSLLPEPLRRLPLHLMAFIAAGLLSTAVSQSPETGLRALLPYVYAVVLIVAFGPVLGRPNRALDAALGLAGAGSLALLSVGALFPDVSPHWRALAFDSGKYGIFRKYQFLLEGSTQLAILTLSLFGILAIARAGRRRVPILADVCLPALFTNVVLASGARVAAPSGLALLAAFHGAQWLQALRAPKSERRRRFGVAVLSMAAVALIASFQLSVRSDATARRTVSSLLDAAVAIIPPLGRFVIPEPFAKEKIFVAVWLRSQTNDAGRAAFQANPLLGGGPGQVRDDNGLEVHNTLLAVAAEMGLAGVLALAPIAWLPMAFVLRARRPLEERILLGLVLVALLLPHAVHFLLRERWTWLFVVVLLCADARRHSATSAGEAPVRL